MVTPAARREAVAYLAATFQMSERRACRVVVVLTLKTIPN